MPRKLFCEICPLTYAVSVTAHRAKRSLCNMRQSNLARTFSSDALPVRVYESASLIRRTLGNVNPELQEGKAVNLSVAAPKLSGILIRPGEEFSFWHLIGSPSARRGYRVGMVLNGGTPSAAVGGGMCQMSNLIHWLILHSPLTVTEHHHHDGYDLFPDYGRTVPFGTGTSVFYNYVDYRFRNDTDEAFQLLMYTDGTHLHGELRSEKPQPLRYHITAEDEHFTRESDGVYRNSRIQRKITDAATGETRDLQCIKINHAKILYDESFVADRLRE